MGLAQEQPSRADMDLVLDGSESSPETGAMLPKRSVSKRPSSPPPTARPSAAAASGIERHASMSSPDRRRQAKGAPVDRGGGGGGGAAAGGANGKSARGWTWGSDRTSLAILERSYVHKQSSKLLVISRSFSDRCV